ncbi:MAG: hypothetical protein KDC92_09780, partial [Bacteroidetes bacterium]|nr:hypothetical protein [Bacteroidota bacterium]
SGQDATMNQSSPSGQAQNTGFTRINAGVFLGFQPLKSNKITLHAEYQLPVYKNVNGVQMEIQSIASIGAKCSF